MDYASISITTELISTANDIKMAVYKNSDPSAVVQSITESGTHAPRTWNFDNLERVMHFYKLLELNGVGTVINTIIGPIYFLPSNQTFELKPPKLIRAGTTPIPGNIGTPWPINADTVTVPDWAGWQIANVERIGQGSLKYDITTTVDMNWDAATAVLNLLQPGDVFQPGEWFLISFIPKIIEASGGVNGSSGFNSILEITTNHTLVTGDIGKKILINPSGNYLEVTLPDIALTAENRITYFEFATFYDNTAGFVNKCAAIKTASGQIIQWLEGNLSQIEICPSESFELYKRTLSVSSFEWRIQNASGNWYSLGEIVHDDIDIKHAINKILFDGSAINYQQFGRLYNRYVLKLPSSQVITYAAWNPADITTYTKFSYVDSVTHNFRVPKALDLFMRASNGSNLPGVYVADSIIAHQHETTIGALPSPPFGHGSVSRIIGNYNDVSNSVSDLTGRSIRFNTATGLWEIFDTGETAPKHRITRVFGRC